MSIPTHMQTCRSIIKQPVNLTVSSKQKSTNIHGKDGIQFIISDCVHTVSGRMKRVFHDRVFPLASDAFFSSCLCCLNVFEDCLVLATVLQINKQIIARKVDPNKEGQKKERASFNIHVYAHNLQGYEVMNIDKSRKHHLLCFL